MKKDIVFSVPAFRPLGAAMLLAIILCLSPSLRAQPDMGQLQTKDQQMLISSSREALARLAQDLTKQCPMEQQSGIRQDSLVYNAPSNTLSFYFTLSSQSLPERNFYEIKYNASMMKEHIANAFINAGKSTQQILLLVSQAQGSLEYVFHRDTMTAAATLSPSEVNQLADNITHGGATSYVKHLQDAVANLNSHLPRQMNEGLTMDSARLDDTRMTYYCTANGKKYKLDMLARSGRQSMEESIRNHDSESSLNLIRQLVAAKRGFRMKYYDSLSSKSAEYTFTPEELAKLL